MIVTTLDLLNYLRCRRYAALDRTSATRAAEAPDLDGDQAFLQDLSVEGHYQSLQRENDETEREGERELERLVNSRYLQTLYELVHDHLHFLHPEQEITEKVRIDAPFNKDLILAATFDFVVKTTLGADYYTLVPMTDSAFVDEFFTVGKQKLPLFRQEADGIFRLVGKTFNNPGNYDEKIAKFSDRHSDIGRHIYDLAVKSFIVDNKYPNANNRLFFLCLNRDYLYEGQKENGKNVYHISLLRCYDLSGPAVAMHETIEADLYRFQNLVALNDDSPYPLAKIDCERGKPFECHYADYCFQHVPSSHSVFEYFGQHLGFREGPNKNDPIHDTYELINSGVVDMLDVPISWLQREKNLMQRYCVENNYVYINKPKVKAILATLKYPLYYLDFEAFPCPLPRFRFEKPYSQSVFQFSVHIEPKPGKFAITTASHHREFLGEMGEDCRLTLVEHLLEAIPEGDSSIIVYNKTFENNRLLELARMFPAHAKRLTELANRLFDLMRVVKNDYQFFLDNGFSKDAADSYNFYHPLMGGSYSLKKVLPAFAKDAYADLAIGNGLKAYLTYATMDLLAEEERAKTKEDLLRYCAQDTYSMHVILHGLQALL